jgi:hypothetical protein
MDSPILGSSYVARSVNAADNRMVNLYPEIIPEGGKEAAFLSRCPGLLRKSSIGTGPIRGLWQTKGVLYAVSGTGFYKVEVYGRTRLKGTLIGAVTGTGPVSMSDNGTQIFIACNPDGFIYNTNTEVFAQITDPDFPGAVTVGYLDGYFVFNEPNSSRVWTTSLLDGTAIDPLSFASAEGSPDLLVSLIVDHQEAWLFGSNSVEVWYDAGTPNFPLQRIQGAFNELGCAAPYSVAKLDNGLFWLGSDDRGRGIVYRSRGYTGIRISTHAIEWQIQEYETISDAVGYTYQQDGHPFYVLIFPSAQTTWVYDAATQAWHERAGWDNGAFARHRSNCQVVFNNEVLVGDFENGNIYAYDLNVYSDNGGIQKWLRSWRALPTGSNDLKRTSHHSLQIDCQTGVGIDDGQGSDPQLILRWSDDGGHTWSNEYWMSMGKIGAYFYRAIQRRLGMTLKLRDRVYEVSGTDPVKIAIMGAQLHVTPTNA